MDEKFEICLKIFRSCAGAGYNDVDQSPSTATGYERSLPDRYNPTCMLWLRCFHCFQSFFRRYDDFGMLLRVSQIL